MFPVDFIDCITLQYILQNSIQIQIKVIPNVFSCLKQYSGLGFFVFLKRMEKHEKKIEWLCIDVPLKHVKIFFLILHFMVFTLLISIYLTLSYEFIYHSKFKVWCFFSEMLKCIIFQVLIWSFLKWIAAIL